MDLSVYIAQLALTVIEVVDWYIGQVNVLTRLCGCAVCAKYPNCMSWFIYIMHILYHLIETRDIIFVKKM